MRCLIFLIPILLTSCEAVRVMEKPVIQESIEYRERVREDSIHILDSVYVSAISDTITVERFRVEYRYKLRVDTFFSVDSVPVPYAVVREVNCLSTWQRWVQYFGYAAMGACVLAILWFINKFR